MSAVAKPAAPIVPALEQMGALSSLLVHDLANHLCIISGNATYAELILHDPERVGAAIRAIVQASELAGEVLGKCGEMRQWVSRGVAPGDVAGTLDWLRRVYGRDPAWQLDIAPGLAGTLVVDPKWIVLAVERIIAQVGAPGGVIRIGADTLGDGATAQPCLAITLVGESPRPFSIKDARATYDNLGLLAAFEILRTHGGRMEPGAKHPTRQEVWLRVPLIAAAAG
jgi:hypothetical protein